MPTCHDDGDNKISNRSDDVPSAGLFKTKTKETRHSRSLCVRYASDVRRCGPQYIRSSRVYRVTAAVWFFIKNTPEITASNARRFAVEVQRYSVVYSERKRGEDGGVKTFTATSLRQRPTGRPDRCIYIYEINGRGHGFSKSEIKRGGFSFFGFRILIRRRVTRSLQTRKRSEETERRTRVRVVLVAGAVCLLEKMLAARVRRVRNGFGAFFPVSPCKNDAFVSL